MTKPTTPTSPSSKEPNESKQKRPWLQKHYEEKRQRTIRLVKAAVDHLVREQQTITIEAICRKSAEVDAEGLGVKKSALLENREAHAYYREHSTSYRAAQTRKRAGKATKPPAQAHPLRIDPQRDVDRVRYRYLQMTKSEIVERLLTVEQAYAELAEQQARLQFAWLEKEEAHVTTGHQARSGQP